jgi:ABC-type molybdate transport system substrate-binding protein
MCGGRSGWGYFSCSLRSRQSAAEVNVLSAKAIATVLQEIGWEFEQTSGHKLNIISELPSEFIKHINAGRSSRPRRSWI